MALGIRELSREVHAWLRQPALAAVLAAIATIPPDKALKPLFSSLCSCEPLVKWHAVSAMGQSVAALADGEMEAARVVMRRFMWMLNDESGGIGWGVPEAMGECLTRHAGLAGEYTHVLVSFMREDGFYLELPALQQGLLWGVARLAAVAPDALRARAAVRYLLPYLDADDHVVKGLACLALGRLGDGLLIPSLSPHLVDTRQLTLYQEGTFLEITVGDIARQAMKQLGGHAG